MKTIPVISKEGFILKERKNGDWVLQIPPKTAEELGLTPGKSVNIISKNNIIIIEPVKEKPLSEILKDVKPENVHKETDTGKDIGNEII
jgi:antitoxin component of MazEF toxin-antitoxin module